MNETWVQPDFQVIDVGMECTAYAAGRPPEGGLPSGGPPADDAEPDVRP
jgi:coenzyme PQQ precursor peptide PqqA